MRSIAPGSQPRPPSACGAFALSELLAVAACLSLVVVVIAPSLEAARQRTKQATCLERLRAIGAANAHYAADDTVDWAIPIHPLQYKQCETQGRCPACPSPSWIGAYEWGGKSGVGSPGFADEPGFLGSRYGTRAGFGPTTRPLNKYLYPHGFKNNFDANLGTWDRAGAARDTETQLEAYRCPADDGPPRAAHCPDWISNPTRSSFDHFGTSYAANTFMIKASGGGGEMRSNSPYLRPISRVPSPARTINYEENIGRWAWAARNEQPFCQQVVGGRGVDPGPTKAIRGWHGKDWIYNRVFVDAHAERQKVYIEGTEDNDGYAQHYFSEMLAEYPNSPGCCSGGEDGANFESYQCIIVRGPGWQKDTLPAAMICTGVVSNGPGRAGYEGCVTNE